jgi:hypothetical protein
MGPGSIVRSRFLGLVVLYNKKLLVQVRFSFASSRRGGNLIPYYTMAGGPGGTGGGIQSESLAWAIIMSAFAGASPSF